MGRGPPKAALPSWTWSYVVFRFGDGATASLVPLAVVLHYDLPLWALAVTTACMNLAGVPGAFLWGKLVGRVQHPGPFVVGGFAMAGLSMAVLAALPPFWLFLAAAAAFTVFGVATGPASSLMILQGVRRQDWGKRTSRLSRRTGLAFLSGMMATILVAMVTGHGLGQAGDGATGGGDGAGPGAGHAAGGGEAGAEGASAPEAGAEGASAPAAGAEGAGAPGPAAGDAAAPWVERLLGPEGVPFTLTFAVAAILAALAAAVAIRTIRPRASPLPHEAGFDPAVVRAGQRRFDRAVYMPGRMRHMPRLSAVRDSLLRPHRLWPLGYVLTFMGSVAFFTSYPGILSSRLGLAAGLVLLCQAPSHLVTPLVYPWAGRHGARIGEGRGVVLGSLLRTQALPALCLLILAADFFGWPWPAFLWALMVLHGAMGLSFALIQVNGPLLLAEDHPQGRGEGVGVYHASVGLGTLLGSAVSFLLLLRLPYWVSYVFAVAAGALGTVLLLVAHRRRQAQSAPPPAAPPAASDAPAPPSASTTPPAAPLARPRTAS